MRSGFSLILAIGLAGAALAGCIDDGTDAGTGVDPGSVVGSAGIDGAVTHQFASHPAYGWPTMESLGALGGAWAPIEYKELPETITGLELVGSVAGSPAGSGIAIFGQYAFNSGGGGGGPVTVVDLSDPANPELVAQNDDKPGTRDLDVIAYPDGRVILVGATNTDILPVYDVTDPAEIYKVTDISTPRGSHNIAVVPGTPILYNGNSAGGGPLAGTDEGTGRLGSDGNGGTEIWDLSDPENPVMVQDWKNGYGCHDITFYINADEEKYRAYCAGIEFTQIWDIADPANPEVIVNIPVHYGMADSPSAEVFLVNFAHLAMVNHDATVLMVGDETGGGAAPGCDVYVDGQVRTFSGPLGNLWFYDISDETNPQLRSWLSPNPPALDMPTKGNSPTCTAHFGRVVEDRNQAVVGFYGAGVVLVDFNDLDHPVIVDQWNEGTDVWDAWYYQGYVVTGDLMRGMDVLTFV